MTDEAFAAQLRTAIATARRQYEAYEEASFEEVGALVDAFRLELERRLPFAGAASDGQLLIRGRSWRRTQTTATA